ncbi:MAG: VWA domain-containing protein [Bryobacterales bacterium]|nr:VWA domain-containing protein [Bryobacterales bacterium]
MSWDRPAMLAVALLPVLWALWLWPRSSRRLMLVLKALSLAAIALALAEPRMLVYESKVALAVLADTSASVSPAGLAGASGIATEAEAARGRHWMRLVPFARAARPADGSEREDRRWALRPAAGEGGRATNLETSVREAIALLPAGLVPRLAVISDGNENVGTAVRAVWQARQLGIPIDTYRAEGRPRPRLEVESVVMPSRVFAGERFPIDVVLRAPDSVASPVRAAVELSAEGKALGTSDLQLRSGSNAFRLYATVAAAGAVDLACVIRAGELGEARFEQALTLRQPKALLISAESVETDRPLTELLRANQFDVTRVNTAAPGPLDAYHLAVINNWDPGTIPAEAKQAFEDFVKQGGGLLWVGGDRNLYEEKNAPEDPLERLLPARLAPPRSPEGTAVVLIIDKSSSMEGKKMELARLAAAGVIENLRPIDMIGVLIFDNTHEWTVPIRRAQDRALLKRLVAGIAADGGTQIAPALAEAYQRIAPVNATYKHIVLLTDGISEEGDSLQVARDASDNRVTISTVGLGQDVNRAYLEKIASFANGKAYLLNDPTALEQILLRDVMEHTGSTTVERPVQPAVVREAEVLAGVGVEAAPPLLGYVRFIAKPSAETLLNIEARDPLLVRWQYGLGRAAVFASDAKGRWATNWLRWQGFDRFWANLARDLLPRSEAAGATVEYNAANDELIADYRLPPGAPEPATLPDVFVFGPGGFQRAATPQKAGSRHYQVRMPMGGRQGLFRLRPLEESRAFPEIGLYRQEPEMSDYGTNEFLLRQIAASTGGRFEPRPRDLFEAGGRSVPATMDLWPAFLVLAILLNLAELLWRKGPGLMEAVRGSGGR